MKQFFKIYFILLFIFILFCLCGTLYLQYQLSQMVVKSNDPLASEIQSMTNFAELMIYAMWGFLFLVFLIISPLFYLWTKKVNLPSVPLAKPDFKEYEKNSP